VYHWTEVEKSGLHVLQLLLAACDAFDSLARIHPFGFLGRMVETRRKRDVNEVRKLNGKIACAVGWPTIHGGFD
jgi:hypothetical protein